MKAELLSNERGINLKKMELSNIPDLGSFKEFSDYISVAYHPFIDQYLKSGDCKNERMRKILQKKEAGSDLYSQEGLIFKLGLFLNYLKSEKFKNFLELNNLTLHDDIPELPEIENLLEIGGPTLEEKTYSDIQYSKAKTVTILNPSDKMTENWMEYLGDDVKFGQETLSPDLMLKKE